MKDENDWIYVCENVCRYCNVGTLKRVSAELIFPTKEPEYSLLTKLRWKLVGLKAKVKRVE